MAKPMFDADALISAFETATAQQGAQLKKAVSDATLASLQGRELTLKNIRAALKAVTDAASAGAAKNLTSGVDAGALLDQAVAGMDQALLKAVEANRVALGQLVSQGAEVHTMSPTDFTAFFERERKQWAGTVAQSGVKID